MNIAALRKKYPALYLYYHDNQQWILYKKRPPEGTYVGEKEHDNCILVEGGATEGYVPDIVQALCDAVGIEVESA